MKYLELPLGNLFIVQLFDCPLMNKFFQY